MLFDLIRELGNDQYLHSSVEKGNTVEQRLPCGQVADFQLVL